MILVGVLVGVHVLRSQTLTTITNRTPTVLQIVITYHNY